MNTNPDTSSQAALPQNQPTYIRELDPIKVQEFQEQMRAEQNLALGIITGSIAALLGAVLWAIITVITNYQIGWMAIGVAFLVGQALRRFGKGTDKVFGFVGAGLALLGCIAGNILMIAVIIAQQETAAILDVLSLMLLNPSLTLELLGKTFTFIDLLFYVFAIYYGYKYSIRGITKAELEGLYRTRVIVQQ